MNLYKSLNEIIEYIENNLENEIEYEKLARILGVNEYTMKSIFSLICKFGIKDLNNLLKIFEIMDII